MQDRNPQACQKALEQYLSHYRDTFANFLVASPDGEVVCSARPLEGLSSISSRDGFQLAISTQDFVVDGYERGAHHTGPGAVAVPARAQHARSAGGRSVGRAPGFSARCNRSPPRRAGEQIGDGAGPSRSGRRLQPHAKRCAGQALSRGPAAGRVREAPSGILEAPGVDGGRLHAFFRIGADEPKALYVVARMPSIDYGPHQRETYPQPRHHHPGDALSRALAWYGVEIYIARNMRVIDATARGLQDGVLTSRTQLDGHRDEMRVVGQAIDEMAAALEHREAGLQSVMHQLSERAVRDSLTGLFNSQYMMECLDREVMHARRTHRPVSVLMFDVDHFKENQRYVRASGRRRGVARAGALVQRAARGKKMWLAATAAKSSCW